MRGLRVAVAGAGIGGLSAALSLLAAGFDVQVYEQARKLAEAGAGVQVSPNASRVLYRLGLADDLARSAVRPLALHQRRWDDGRTLLRTPLGEPVEEQFGFPHYQMHRADLLAALVGAFPADRLHLGHRLAAVDDDGDRVRLSFAAGNGDAQEEAEGTRGKTGGTQEEAGGTRDNTGGTQEEVDVLVGADGIHSTVRDLLFGAGRPRFTGCAAYRGLIPAERLDHLSIEVSVQVWMGPGGHFVHYYVSSGRLLNFVAVVERDAWGRESWTDRGDVAEARAAYDGWHPQVRGILDAVDETFEWALFDRPPLERWSRGRVTLLGDACHPMLPFMAQGAAQAIEDGATLAACLAQGGDPAEALLRYERLRLPRASRVQALSADNKIRFHLPDGPDQRARDEAMAAGGTDFSYRAVEWLYRHDAAAPI